jgi:HYDIN/CFA65/VesB-like, Ig-like domain
MCELGLRGKKVFPTTKRYPRGGQVRRIRAERFDMKTTTTMRSIVTIAALAVLPVILSQSLKAQNGCGTGYATGMAATTTMTGSGTGLTINITSVDSSGVITGSTLGSGGSGYALGDIGQVTGGGGSGSFYNVDAVNSGVVSAYHLFSGFLNLNNTSPAVPADIVSPDAKFTERQNAFINFGLCQPLPPPNNCGNADLGENFQVWMFSRLASSDASKQQEAINYLKNIQRSDIGAMGTDTATDCPGGISFSGLLSDLEEFFTDAARRGDGDTAMIGFVTALYKYKSVLPPDVADHLLSLIDLNPGPGGVETISFGADPVTSCAAICPIVCATTGNPFTCGACPLTCVAALEVERVTVPETENHRNMIYVAQYLANQLWLEKTGDPKYDNAQNGYRALLLNRMKDFVRNDFIEYNAHNYQDFDMFALLSLYSNAADPKVQAAAKMALDYISAKVAVSSDDARRSTPFRRRNEDGHTCGELVLQDCTDPQVGFYMMLAGVTDILGKVHDILPDKFAPPTYSVEFAWAASTDYRIDPLILDLFVDRSHRKFYQFFHYSRKLEFDDFQDSNDELYFSSPSYLISAGGHGTHYAYTADVPFPISLFPESLSPLETVGSHPGSNKDVGFAPPTTLMPTNDLHSRDQMIRFDPGMCVARNFACGFNPVVPYATTPDPSPKAGVAGTWSFLDKHGDPNAYGYYVAIYKQDNFGFFEVCDTFSTGCGDTVADFIQKVHANNDDKTFSSSGTNTYRTIDGTLIEFSVADTKILNINGLPPYDPNRTSGDIINNDGKGMVTISNPLSGKMPLTLDATIPPDHPSITVPGPLNFADTCVGSKSFATLNVCNDGNGTDNLVVYNILSPSNTQFQVTEPTSGYPTTIGSNFCFPFQAQFAPKMTGAISAKLTISNSDPGVPEFKLDVTGNGIQQGIATVISNSGDFGNVCVGSFTDLNLTINNNGGCDLVITGINSDTAEFTVAGALNFPLTIHAGGSLAVPIRFHPSKFGPFSGNITVANNDPVTPNAVVQVKGNAPPPVINASIANTGSFGNVCAGTQSDLTLQVVNQGLCPLTISSVGVNPGTGFGPSFTLPSVTNYPVVLGASSSVNLPIRFQPPAYPSANYITCSNTVPQTANIVIHSDDPVYPDVTGGFVRSVNGIEGCPTLVLSPQNLTGIYAFPATVSDPNGTLGCYTDRQITVSNSGICPLNIVSLTTANGSDGKGMALPVSPLEFNVTNPTVPIIVAPGAAPVPVTVRFKPVILTDQNSAAPDQQTGTLSIVSNDPVPADNGAGLCGEPAYQSGARVLVVNTTNNPVSNVASIALSSKGLTPPFNQTLKPAPLLSAPNICGNTIQYHLDNETLRPAGTTGNNPKASYTLSAKNGSTQANMSFTLGQCQVQQIVLQIK